MAKDKWSINNTVGVIFIDTFAPHETVIAYEQADIDDYREDSSWVECGKCVYDSYKKEIVEMIKEDR